MGVETNKKNTKDDKQKKLAHSQGGGEAAVAKAAEEAAAAKAKAEEAAAERKALGV